MQRGHHTAETENDEEFRYPERSTNLLETKKRHGVNSHGGGVAGYISLTPSTRTTFVLTLPKPLTETVPTKPLSWAVSFPPLHRCVSLDRFGCIQNVQPSHLIGRIRKFYYYIHDQAGLTHISL